MTCQNEQLYTRLLKFIWDRRKFCEVEFIHCLAEKHTEMLIKEVSACKQAFLLLKYLSPKIG